MFNILPPQTLCREYFWYITASPYPRSCAEQESNICNFPAFRAAARVLLPFMCSCLWAVWSSLIKLLPQTIACREFWCQLSSRTWWTVLIQTLNFLVVKAPSTAASRGTVRGSTFCRLPRTLRNSRLRSTSSILKRPKGTTDECVPGCQMWCCKRPATGREQRFGKAFHRGKF